MKKLAILIAAACTLSFTACELEMYPENKLVNEQALQTFEDLQKFEVGVYAAFRANFTDGYVVGAELQSDYMNAVFGFGNNYGGLHRWDFDIEDYDIIDFWTACYYTIANVNFVLSQKDVITYEDGEAAAADEIFGEMYFMRAMSHYMLIEKFCGNYDASMQLLEEGKFTDSLGREYDLDKYIIVFTSNMPKEKVGEYLPAELRSRFSYKCAFWPLSTDEKEQYVAFKSERYLEEIKRECPSIEESLKAADIVKIDVSRYSNMRDINSEIMRQITDALYSEIVK